MQDHHTTTPSGVTTKMVLLILDGNRGYLPGAPKLLRAPQAFKGPHEAFILMIFTFMGCIFTLFLTFPALSGLNQ